MKRLLIILVAVVFLVGVAWANGEKGVANEKEEKVKVQCPKTRMVESCLLCHVTPSFKLKEGTPDETLVYPNRNMKILEGVGYYFLEDIEADKVNQFFDYLRQKKINRAVIEIYSPGGGLFQGQKIISLIQHFQAEGGTVETRCHGFAASAGFLIFCAGEKGKRFVAPEAEFMWHEIMTFKMFSIETPSDQEEQSRILRHLQDTRNSWLATRGKLTKEDIDSRIKKKEWWMNGRQMVEMGFADGFLQ